MGRDRSRRILAPLAITGGRATLLVPALGLLNIGLFLVLRRRRRGEVVDLTRIGARLRRGHRQDTDAAP